MTVQIMSVRCNRAGRAVVQFTDGHTAIFEENRGGFGAPTAVQRIWLELEGNIVAMYYSPNQLPANYKPFGLRDLAEGYNQARVADYWKAALDYVVAEQRQGRLTDAWRVIDMGRSDIEELSAASA